MACHFKFIASVVGVACMLVLIGGCAYVSPESVYEGMTEPKQLAPAKNQQTCQIMTRTRKSVRL